MAEKGDSRPNGIKTTDTVSCPVCTILNGSIASVCYMCGAILPSEDNGTSWICLRCTLTNPGMSRLTDNLKASSISASVVHRSHSQYF